MNRMFQEMANATVQTLQLGERIFRLRELNWNDLCELEEQLGSDPERWQGARALRTILWLALRKEDPSLTPEAVGELLTLADAEQVLQAAERVLGGATIEETPKNDPPPSPR
ncbi:MAG: hypothetical protein KatS3mg115_1385 [Candidatus Poribacteria bacterium]|nr:MAG: hypothetical protein KatS3mg115_1385 [Candidatus Poribacteria bacterium]